MHTCSACLHLQASRQCRSCRLGPITTTITITYSTTQRCFPRCNTISLTTTCTRLFHFRFTSITITMRTSMRLSNHSQLRARRCRSVRCRHPRERRWECPQRVHRMRLRHPHPCRLEPRRHPCWGQGCHGRRRRRCHWRCGMGGCSTCHRARRGNPHPGAPKGTPPVATGGVPPAGPTPTVPPTLPAEAQRVPQAPLAPTPQEEPVGARYAEAQHSQPAKVTGAPPAPAVPGAPVTGGLGTTYGARPAPAECRGAPPMKGLPAAVQAMPVAQGAAVAGPPNISELLAQALEMYQREAAGGAQAEPAATGADTDVGELIAQALAASRRQGVVSTPDVATVAEEAVGERMELR